MIPRIAINGFGRIGRLILRAMAENDVHDLKVVAINDISPLKDSVHLLKHDSVHGFFRHVTHTDDTIDVGFGPIKMLSHANPQEISWKDLNVDIVLECSGHFASRASEVHLRQGADRVLISAPADGADITVVYGVNHEHLRSDHRIVSNGSCTTNCLAPVAYVLQENLGIEHGHMTTIHAFTGDQRLIDSAHRDLRRARAATLSMIPTSTGAARALGLVIPSLQGKLEGTAIRVPCPNVSLIDLTFTSESHTTAEAINEMMRLAAAGPFKGILDIADEPLVSIDFNHNPASACFDVTQTHVVNGRLCRILAWYDNEWGFANRMIDVARLMGRF